jgi:hypothetical protein
MISIRISLCLLLSLAHVPCSPASLPIRMQPRPNLRGHHSTTGSATWWLVSAEARRSGRARHPAPWKVFWNALYKLAKALLRDQNQNAKQQQALGANSDKDL